MSDRPPLHADDPDATRADLKQRIAELEAQVMTLIAQIESWTVVPNYADLKADVARLEAQVSDTLAKHSIYRASCDRIEKELRTTVESYRTALEFYADPETYFAIGFFPDPPCGEFIEDFDETDKPGKRAREALDK